MKSWVDISIAGRATERHRLTDASTTSVGSSAPAAIQLRGVEGLMPEHFSLRPQPEGCWVELVESAPEPFTFEGRPSRGSLVPWGHEIFYGSVRLSLNAEDPLESAKRTSPLVWVAAVAIPLAASSFLFKQDASAHLESSPTDNPPALFGTPPACSEQGPGALGRGSIAEQIAYAKDERGAYELKDAIDAIQLMREAAQCYALAGHEGRADRAARKADDWIRELNLSYQRALLQLELGRRTENSRQVLASAMTLSMMLAHAGPEADSFKSWLDTQARRQRAKRALEAKSKKKK